MCFQQFKHKKKPIRYNTFVTIPNEAFGWVGFFQLKKSSLSQLYTYVLEY